MANVRYIAGIFQVALGVLLFVQFIIDPLYPAGIDNGAVWNVFNIPMLLGLLIALSSSWHRKRTVDRDEGITREYLEANVSFWASVALAMWFLHTWFTVLTGGETQWWTETDTLAVLVYVPTGLWLMRNARNG